MDTKQLLKDALLDVVFKRTSDAESKIKEACALNTKQLFDSFKANAKKKQ
jgi:hypothetical protein